MFESANGDFDIQKNHINGKGEYVITAGIANCGILGKSDVAARIFSSNTITIDMFGNTFYRSFCYKLVTHARVFSIQPKFRMLERQGLFFSNSFHFLTYYFGYQNMCSWAKIQNLKIQLPTKNGEIDFEFMGDFVAELEAQRVTELEAYLTVTGLKDYYLTLEEEQALRNIDELVYGTFNLESLFGKSTRGKRLKSDDRLKGDLPFVTAGENNEGISDFISNEVEVFSRNTITIDMFGSAKYRNYDYGADDHIAVVHTEKLEMDAAIFVTSSIHKSSYNGQFHYGRNFYAKDADNLSILLPIKDNKPDFEVMKLIISAVKKLVIKDVVDYADRKIQATAKVIGKL